MRIGHGFDVHKFGGEGPIIIGGVPIPYEQGLLAHSDGDVVMHAIADALLGAAGMRDIGFHFPDTSEEFKNIDSKKLLVKVVRLVGERGYKVGNVDCTVAMQTPKLMGYISDMERKLADILNIEKNDVSVKATTTERLGFEGREEGVSVYAVALLYKNEIEDI